MKPCLYVCSIIASSQSAQICAFACGLGGGGSNVCAFACGMGDGGSNVSAKIVCIGCADGSSGHHFYILPGLCQTDTDVASESE
jgi:hypothetical protein